MTNRQIRLIAMPLVMIASALICQLGDDFVTWVGLIIFLLAGIAFLIEFFTSLRKQST